MRYTLIDFNHLAHKCFGMPPLHSTVNIGGEIRVVDTTIATSTIKNVFNYSGRGQFHTGCFFEGGNPERKAYFAPPAEVGKVGKAGSGYKGNRNNSNKGGMYEGVELAINLMHNGKVSLFRQEGFEADDLIASMVQKIKSTDTTTPIDIITNDSDMLPFVDDQVSVYMRAMREHAQDGCPTRRLYYQVTPETWTEFLSYTSAYRDFTIPFNSMLLFKMIRGDKADNVPMACKGYGGVKYSQTMEQMMADGVDFENIFRYGLDFDTVMKPVLENYFTVEQMEMMKFIYIGISPKYTNLQVPKMIEPGYLQSALNPVNIHIIK